MEVIDPGHTYILQTLDGDYRQSLVFVKREGPSNQGSYPGTTIQDVCRVLIDRTIYLDKQHPCVENYLNLYALRQIIYNLEHRAAREHGSTFTVVGYIEDMEPCAQCGHIFAHNH